MDGKLMEYYRAIEDGSARMLEAARAEEWEEVVRFEKMCAVLIEQLRHQARKEELSAEQRVEKTRIMQRILKNDSQIRHLAEPWFDQLGGGQTGQPSVLH